MSADDKPTLRDQIDGLEDRGSDLRFQLQNAGELLKRLAEAMSEKHAQIDNPDYAPWTNAEYLADQICAHAAALGDVMEDLQRLGMAVGRGDDGDAA